MELKRIHLLVFFMYLVVIATSVQSMKINREYPPRTWRVIKQMLDYYNKKTERDLHDDDKSYRPVVRGKRPFFMQPISPPLKRYGAYSPPLKRIVCNRENNSNCNYLFTFLNRS